jgi:hypothetical protein
VLVAGVREARDDYGLVDGRWVVAAVEVTALRDNVSTPSATSAAEDWAA